MMCGLVEGFRPVNYSLSVTVHSLVGGVMVRPVILQSECDGSLIIKWRDGSPRYFTI